MCIALHMNPMPTESRTGCEIPLKLEFQAVEPWPMWMLGTQLKCCRRAEGALKLGTFCQVLFQTFLKKCPVPWHSVYLCCCASTTIDPFPELCHHSKLNFCRVHF